MLPLLGDTDEGCLAGANPTIEKYFHDCIYDTRDLIGFYLGLCSITCWMVAQLPQLITNYHRQSAEALSPFFLAQWLLGDTCNLVGALLKGDQPETVILTAQYFICMDVVLLLQFLYYTAVARRIERTYTVLAASRRHHRHHGHRSTRDTSTRRHHHHHRHGDSRREEEGVPSSSGGRLGGATAREEESVFENTATHNGIESSIGSKLNKRVLTAAAVGTTTVALACFHPSSFSVVAAVAAEAVQKSLILLQNFQSVASGSLLALGMKHWKQSAGSVLGYISCVLYLASRISQILKNVHRQSAEGLASSMFLCAVAANLFYGTSVLLRSRTKDEILSSLPWVLGSLGTVGLDGLILVQTVLFAKEERKNTPASNAGDIGDDVRSDIEQPLLLEGSAE